MKRAVLLGLAAASLLAAPGAWAQKSPEQELEEADAEFRQQHYRRTTDLLNPLLYPTPRLKNVDDVHQAREMLGASYWQLGELQSAEREFERLLHARPSFQLDEFYYPKPMRDFVGKLRDTLVQQGLIKVGIDAETPREAPPPTVLRIDNTIVRTSRSTAFMPFGAGQFEAGKDGLGWFFLSTQAATGVASLGTFLAAYGMQWQNHTIDDNTQTLYYTAMGVGAAFWALYVWSTIDANVRYEPERVVRTERTIVPNETADLRPPQPKPAPAAGGSR